MRFEMDAPRKPILAKPPRPVMTASAVVFIVALATILAALAFEHLGGYAPCPLCLEERYAYYLAIPAAAAAWYAARLDANGVARVLLVLIALAFLVNAGLGVFHSGVEWKWWAGPAACSGASELEWGEGGLSAQLENAQVIRCDEASWRFLWLSFAGWNAVISAFLAVVAAFGAAHRR
jgi:disulfide bond formation protein DsbB